MEHRLRGEQQDVMEEEVAVAAVDVDVVQEREKAVVEEAALLPVLQVLYGVAHASTTVRLPW